MLKRVLVGMIFLPTLLAAQTPEQGTPFIYSDANRSSEQPRLVGVGIDPATKTLTVYGWQLIRGVATIRGEAKPVNDAGEPKETKKKGGGLMGALNKVAEASSKVSITTGNDITVAPLLTQTKLELATLKPLQKNRDVIVTDNLPDGQTARFSSREYSSNLPDGLNGIGMNQSITVYPDFHASFRPVRQTKFGRRGEGLLGIKNIHRTFDKVEKSVKVDPQTNLPIETERILSSYPATENLENVSIVSELIPLVERKTWIVATSISDDDEKWSAYMHYQILEFDSTGHVKQRIVDLPFQFIRALQNVVTVFDEQGKTKGSLFIFGSSVTGAAKKYRDPNENNHAVVFIDNTGQVRFNYTFELGNPEKSRGFGTVLVIQREDKLHCLSYNSDNILKDHLETVVLGPKGMESVTAIEEQKSQGRLYMAARNGNPQFLGDKFWFFSQSELGSNEQRSYQDVHLESVTPDFKTLTPYFIQVKKSNTPTYIEPIAGSPNPSFILTTPINNSIVRINEKGLSEVAVKPETYGRNTSVSMPPLFVNRPNYVIDHEQRKAYFVYELNPGQGLLVGASY